jgi:hypothetical protein
VRISWALVISGAPRSKISFDGFGQRHKPLFEEIAVALVARCGFRRMHATGWIGASSTRRQRCIAIQPVVKASGSSTKIDTSTVLPSAASFQRSTTWSWQVCGVR